MKNFCYRIFKAVYVFCSPLIYAFYYPGCRIERSLIHPSSKIEPGVEIKLGCIVGRNITIGAHTYINEYSRIDTSTAAIGRFCSLSHNVKIGMPPHPLDRLSTSPVFYSQKRGYVAEDEYGRFSEKGPAYLDHDVYIAANVIVYAGVHIGTGAVIAAGSVVTKDVPPYAIMGGMPAKLIRYRFDQVTRQRLLASEWWQKDLNWLINHRHLMDDIPAFLAAMENS